MEGVRLIANGDFNSHSILLKDYSDVDEFIKEAYRLTYDCARSLYLFVEGEYYFLDCIEELCFWI